MAARLLILTVLFVLAAASPAAAQFERPIDVQRIESAMSELARGKNSVETRLRADERAATEALLACRSKGRGWRRIRGVKDRAQREAYARGARTLWKNLNVVALEGAWVEAYGPFFERFLDRFETPLSDSILQAGVDAQRKRLAFDRAAYSFGTCGTFNNQLRKVRQFSVGGEHGVSGDYYAGKIYNQFVRYVATRQRAAVRAHWGSRYENALDAASAQLKALGGNEGIANYFRFAFKG